MLVGVFALPIYPFEKEAGIWAQLNRTEMPNGMLFILIPGMKTR